MSIGNVSFNMGNTLSNFSISGGTHEEKKSADVRKESTHEEKKSADVHKESTVSSNVTHSTPPPSGSSSSSSSAYSAAGKATASRALGSDVRTPKIKHSSLSYLNAAGRAGFEYKKYYNDFTNEGHMYPVHGVGDLDSTRELMEKFVKSYQGEEFPITDLGVKIKVTDEHRVGAGESAFFDFHTIPTKLLDGSAKLPCGRRIEQFLPYFGTVDPSIADMYKLDWVTGMAVAVKESKLGTTNWGNYASLYGDFVKQHGPDAEDKRMKTTLYSTRATPFLRQDENLGLVFFSDGPQARVNNGGKVTNWRFVCPAYALDMVWFVARAWKPDEVNGKEVTTSHGKTVRITLREDTETNDLSSIAYEQNRYMEVVTEPIKITNGYSRHSAFNQRYPGKGANFGDLILKDTYSRDIQYGNDSIFGEIHKNCDDLFDKYVTSAKFPDKQIAFNLMLDVAKEKLVKLAKEKDTNPTAIYTELKYDQDKSYCDETVYWKSFIDRYIETKTYNISPQALHAKAFSRREYMPVNIGETGWMVVDLDGQLEVPNDEGEYFIGWAVETQAPDRISPQFTEGFTLAQSKGWAMHQGPGMLYMTGGDYPHIGTQEPYLLEQNYNPGDSYKSDVRVKSQLPTVHWRLDAPSVIAASIKKGAIVETNVGAGQLMLQSVGTQTPLYKVSRSQNFLAFLQNLGLSGNTLKDVLDLMKNEDDSANANFEQMLEDGKLTQRQKNALDVYKKSTYISKSSFLQDLGLSGDKLETVLQFLQNVDDPTSVDFGPLVVGGTLTEEQKDALDKYKISNGNVYKLTGTTVDSRYTQNEATDNYSVEYDW